MFFHWHDVPGEGTSYAQVLAALPDRMAAVGWENESASIMGEVVGRYGAG